MTEKEIMHQLIKEFKSATSDDFMMAVMYPGKGQDALWEMQEYAEQHGFITEQGVIEDV